MTDESPSRRKSTPGDASIRRSIQVLALSAEVEDVRPFRRTEKARGFERAVSAGRDLGDAWGWWLKFERQHGTAAQQEDVIVRCQAAEPSHGETWQPIAKDDKNGGKSAKEILELVAAALH